MTNVVTTVETSIEVGMEDFIAFIKNDAWPDIIAVAKDVISADLKALLPIATNAVSEIAVDATNLTNPAMIGQVLSSVLSAAASQAGTAISHTTVTTAAIAVAQSMQAAASAAPAQAPAA